MLTVRTTISQIFSDNEISLTQSPFNRISSSYFYSMVSVYINEFLSAHVYIDMGLQNTWIEKTSRRGSKNVNDNGVF